MPVLKRFLFFIALMLVSGLAGGVLWFNSLDDEQIGTSHWLARSLDKVQSVHFQGVDESYTLNRAEDSWEAQVPGPSWNVTAKVYAPKVVEYLSRVSDMAPNRSVGGADEFGLDSAGVKLILNYEKGAGKPLTIRLLQDESGRVFGWNSDSPALVFEFDADVFGQIALPATFFLDNRVFTFEEKAVSKVQLVQPFGSSWLVEREKSGFQFVLPGYLKGKNASDSELELYLHALALLRAGRLVLEPVVTDKEMAALTIKVWTKGQEPAFVEFYTVENDPGVYLGRSSWLTVPFLLDVESVGQLIRSAFDVQGRHVFTFDIGNVERIHLDYGHNAYLIVRLGDGWWVRGGEKDVPGIDMSLWRFTELQFEALPLNNLSETAVELMKCRLEDADRKVIKEMTFYADPNLPKGQCWMKNGDGMYYPVSNRLLKDLQGMFPAGPVKE